MNSQRIDEHQKALFNQICKRVAFYTKKSPEDVKALLAQAQEEGIPPQMYLRFRCWQLQPGDRRALPALLEKMKEKQDEDAQWYLTYICRKSHLPMGMIKRKMDAFLEIGISPYQFAKRGLYYPFKGINSKNRALASLNPNPISKKNLHFFENIRKKTGWKPAKVEMEVSRAWVNCGADYADYYLMGMDKLSPGEQAQNVTREHYQKLTLLYNNYFLSRLLDRKQLFNHIFSDSIQRKWANNRHLSYRRFLELISGVDALIVKPVSTSQGKGIEKFPCASEDPRALYQRIRRMPESVVEEYITQHPALSAYCDTSVNTIRIVTLNAQKECRFLYAIVRMGRGSVVDNVHAGGITAAVDIETGVVLTDAIDLDGERYPVNPYSGLAIKGFKVPHWDKVLETCRRCYNRIPGVRLIGWDFAITESGVDLIEGNSGPAFFASQALALQLPENTLRQTMIDPYLPGA